MTTNYNINLNNYTYIAPNLLDAYLQFNNLFIFIDYCIKQ